jgi:hypothetical protein
VTLKQKAHSVATVAIKNGRLVAGTCEQCGAVLGRTPRRCIHAHHDDYAEPMKVRWLCSHCHHKLHGLERRGVAPKHLRQATTQYIVDDTATQMLAKVEAAVKAAGTAKALAEEWRVSQAYLSDVRAGKREPGPAILDRLGLSATTQYIADANAA